MGIQWVEAARHPMMQGWLLRQRSGPNVNVMLTHVGTEESKLRCLESSPAGRRAVPILPGGTGRLGVPTEQ